MTDDAGVTAMLRAIAATHDDDLHAALAAMTDEFTEQAEQWQAALEGADDADADYFKGRLDSAQSAAVFTQTLKHHLELHMEYGDEG